MRFSLNPRYWFQKRSSDFAIGKAEISNRMRYNALYMLDPDVLVRHLSAFAAGDIAGLEHVIEDFENRDDKMKIGAFKMAAAVASKPWEVRIAKGEEDNERARLHKEVLTRFWNRIEVTDAFCRNRKGGVRLLVKQMMSAESRVYAVHDLVWNVRGDGELTATFTQIPAWCFENRTGELRYLREPGAYTGEPMRAGEWLVTVGEGVGVTAAILAMSKRLSWNDWLLFSEKCGMPLILGNTGAKENSPAWNALLSAIAAIAPKTGILTDLNSKMQAVQIGGSSGQATYKDLVETVDRAISALYRGGDLATMSSTQGEGTGSDAQDGESELMDGDGCAMVSETLHNQIDRFVIRFTCGDFEPLAGIVINPPAETTDIDREIKIDNHLAALGVKLSKADALQRYGRTEAESDDDALQTPPNGPQNGLPSGFGGLPNERTPATPLQTALQGVAKREEGSGRITTPESGDAPQRAILAAFAKDTSKAAEAVKALLAEEDPSKLKALSSKLLADLPSLIPDDPALAAVIADAMAAEFGSPDAPAPSGALANEDQPRGKTTPGTNDGSFSPAGGGSSESKKAREKREKAERQARHMSQGVSSMQHVLAGNDVENFMPGFKNARVNYTHIAFYQGDSESGYLHIKNHAPDRNGILNHQAMLQGGKIPETIAKGTWYDDGHGIRVVYNDQLVILGKDGDGLRVLSAYVSSEKARSTRSDNRLVRLMNEKEGAL